MGTRHMIGVMQNGEWKIAQYGQWDGYPDGQGIGVLRFLNSFDLNYFREQVAKCNWISDEIYNTMWKEFGVDMSNEEKWIDYDLGKRFDTKHPELSRDTGSDILELVWRSKDGLLLQDSHEFAKDSLFCEWCYIIDLDENTFEIYKGFNKNPISKSSKFYDKNDIVKEYYPVRLVKLYELDNLPTEDEFLNFFKEDIDEDNDTLMF